MPLCAAALATALLVGAPPAAPAAALSQGAFRRAPDLTLRLVDRGLVDPGVAPARPERKDAAPPACVADLCQPSVAVPGFEPRYGRASRSELFVYALQRARIEPIATVAWTLVATGLRFDWAPPSFDGNANAHGWGSAMLRLRIRIDATNHFVFPKRPRAS